PQAELTPQLRKHKPEAVLSGEFRAVFSFFLFSFAFPPSAPHERSAPAKSPNRDSAGLRSWPSHRGSGPRARPGSVHRDQAGVERKSARSVAPRLGGDAVGPEESEPLSRRERVLLQAKAGREIRTRTGEPDFR